MMEVAFYKDESGSRGYHSSQDEAVGPELEK